jgi:signal transduction histidine kinase
MEPSLPMTSSLDSVALRVARTPVSAHQPQQGLAAILESLAAALDVPWTAVVSASAGPGVWAVGHGLGPGEKESLVSGGAAIVAGAGHDAPTSVDDAALGSASAIVIPHTRGETALVIGTGTVTADHRDVIAVAIERLGGALESARLRSDLERAMAQILESDERLLGRIGLDIHDGPTQALSVALLEIQLLEAELADAESQGAVLPDALRPAIGRIYETLGGALHEMRELIGHLRPAQFENRRLTEILNDAIIAFEARSGSQVVPDMVGDFPVNGVSVTQRITFYRILQEALNNAHRHGRATTVGVAVREDAAGILLEVADNGGGFDAERALRPRPGAPIARFGLHGMRDRATVLGGTFAVVSTDAGTTVRVFLPTWRPGDEDANLTG